MQSMLQNLKQFQFISGRMVLLGARFGSVHHSLGSIHTLTLQERVKLELPPESNNTSIYKAPENLLRVERKAYEPNIVSIGPYHHGKSHLQPMEKVKLQFLRRAINVPGQSGQAKLKDVTEAVEGLEQEARGYYSEDLKMSKDRFVDMMVLDGCFILELIRRLDRSRGKEDSELESGTVVKRPILSGRPASLQRWMLPVLRYDLIMLENQLPLPVLRKLYEKTRIIGTSSSSSLEQLALDFFSPLMPGDAKRPQLNENGENAKHLLDLFRSSILPRNKKTGDLPGNTERGDEPYLFRSMVELRESGVKVKNRENHQPLDIKFDSGVLEIPQFCINDYRCTLYRNMVAFEQCHKDCKPDVTRYLFFLDGLINSAKDVEILHYAGVLQHTLGNNKHVARTVNKLCREVFLDTKDSYLYDVVQGIKEYCNTPWHRQRSILVHNYFTNLWVTVSTGVAVILVYLSVLQTCCSLLETHVPLKESGFWTLFGRSLTIPISHAINTVTGKIIAKQEINSVIGYLAQLDQFHDFLWLHC